MKKGAKNAVGVDRTPDLQIFCLNWAIAASVLSAPILIKFKGNMKWLW